MNSETTEREKGGRETTTEPRSDTILIDKDEGASAGSKSFIRFKKKKCYSLYINN